MIDRKMDMSCFWWVSKIPPLGQQKSINNNHNIHKEFLYLRRPTNNELLFNKSRWLSGLAAWHSFSSCEFNPWCNRNFYPFLCLLACFAKYTFNFHFAASFQWQQKCKVAAFQWLWRGIAKQFWIFLFCRHFRETACETQTVFFSRNSAPRNRLWNRPPNFPWASSSYRKLSLRNSNSGFWVSRRNISVVTFPNHSYIVLRGSNTAAVQ